MKIPFSLIDSSTGDYVTGKTSSITVKSATDGSAYTALTATITEPDTTNAPGQYCMEITLPTFTDYCGIIITCTGCDTIRKIIYPEATTSTGTFPTTSQIADAVWDDAMATSISTNISSLVTDVENLPKDILTHNVGTDTVTSNAYTLKHLIMASQKSEFVTDDGVTKWQIRDSSGNIIATRTLTLNSNGAITKTE